MIIGTATDGQLLEWDEESLAFTLGGRPTGLKSVRALHVSGSIVYVNAETEAWAREVTGAPEPGSAHEARASLWAKKRPLRIAAIVMGLVIAAGAGYAGGSYESRVVTANWEKELAAAKKEAFREGALSRNPEIMDSYDRGRRVGVSSQRSGIDMGSFNPKATSKSQWYAVQFKKNRYDSTGKMPLVINAISDKPISIGRLPYFPYHYSPEYGVPTQ